LIDLGCMQINHRYHGAEFSSVGAMLDPHANVDYAARFLARLHARHETWTMAVARYHAGPEQRPGAKALHLQSDFKSRRHRTRSVDRARPRILRMMRPKKQPKREKIDRQSKLMGLARTRRG
jgi:soluble lytic murein transglycosylase-like protein